MCFKKGLILSLISSGKLLRSLRGPDGKIPVAFRSNPPLWNQNQSFIDPRGEIKSVTVSCIAENTRIIRRLISDY